MELTLESPLGQALTSLVQSRLGEEGWTTGGTDDSALGEYIMLMLVNGKNREQLASELSTDLLGLSADDPAPQRFSQWLFEQAERLHQQQTDTAGVSENVASNGAPEAVMDDANEEDLGTSIKGAAATRANADADMQEAESNIPRGPRAMRDEMRPGNKRMMHQMSRAMERSNDPDRVRSQYGNDRVHSRSGPRTARRQNPDSPRMSSMKNGSQMSPHQQMQLLHLLEDQTRMMAQILPANQQQQIMQNLAQFDSTISGKSHPGRSLFDRVDDGRSIRRRRNSAANGAGDKQEGGPETMCKFNLKCSKKDCIFAHQSPAAPPGIIVDVTDVCKFGAACKNRKCVGRHPSPFQKVAHAAEQDCKYFPNCTNAMCPFRHPDTPACRFGADCSRPDCKFVHVTVECKFNPCLNPSCVYKHVEGQKRGKFGDKVWTANGSEEHVSERKFVDSQQQGDEELIIPEAPMEDPGPSSPASAVLVT